MGSARRVVVAVAALVMAFGCITKESTLMTSVDMWHWKSAESISYINEDTLSLRHLNIALRYNKNFAQAKLPLKVTVTAPDARSYSEAVELSLHHPYTAMITATTESLPYRRDVVFQQRGEYIISFEPLAEVRGVQAVGIEFIDKE